MFTGIVEELGRVVELEPKATGARLTIACSDVLRDADAGREYRGERRLRDGGGT